VQGSLRQRGQRSWELRVLNGRDALTGRKAYLQKTAHGTKREAETKLARFVTEVSDGAHASTKGSTVGELIEQWFSYNELDWSPTGPRDATDQPQRLPQSLKQARR
jgi:hypothetical protein